MPNAATGYFTQPLLQQTAHRETQKPKPKRKKKWLPDQKKNFLMNMLLRAVK